MTTKASFVGLTPGACAELIRTIVADVYPTGGVEHYPDDAVLAEHGQGWDYRPELLKALGKPYHDLSMTTADADLWVTVGDVVSSVWERHQP